MDERKEKNEKRNGTEKTLSKFCLWLFREFVSISPLLLFGTAAATATAVGDVVFQLILQPLQNA